MVVCELNWEVNHAFVLKTISYSVLYWKNGRGIGGRENKG